MASDTYRLTPHETVTVLGRDGDLVLEAEYAGGGSPPPEHLHPSQDERFEVLSGSLSARVGGVDRPLADGDVLEVPRGTPHQLWNAGSRPARVRWTTSPPGRTEEWFATVERLGAGGRMDVLGFAAAAPRFADTFVLSGRLAVVMRILAPVARRLRR